MELLIKKRFVYKIILKNIMNGYRLSTLALWPNTGMMNGNRSFISRNDRGHLLIKYLFSQLEVCFKKHLAKRHTIVSVTHLVSFGYSYIYYYHP